MTDLFEKRSFEGQTKGDDNRPLADRLRPQSVDGVTGQPVATNLLSELVARGAVESMIFVGPPGCGKTTLARAMANELTETAFVPISAIFSGVGELRKIFDQAKIRRENGKTTLLFVDEIHRFNKSQQDAFLPYVEDGTIILIGATTENPSFELNAALLSRCQVVSLTALTPDDLSNILSRAEDHLDIQFQDPARDILIQSADGDARYLLNMVERVANLADGDGPITADLIKRSVRAHQPRYDKSGDQHYDLISALHKAVRGSDVDGALYWLARMLAGGEDPRFIARRLTRMAVEDIGLADPRALRMAMSGWELYDRLGTPEGELGLAQVVVYLASAPKSDGVYSAFKQAKIFADKHGSPPPPDFSVNAPTDWMKGQGRGKGYYYDHDQAHGVAGQNYFPDGVERQQFYDPPPRGFEREVRDRLNFFAKKRAEFVDES